MPLSAAHQTTLATTAVFAGVGLHTGAQAKVAVRPAPADAGLSIQRVDEARWGGPCALNPQLVAATQLSTVLDQGGSQIMTVEHLFSALAGLGVDNAVVEVSGPEIPALDGSAAPFVAGLRRAGLIRQKALRRFWTVTKPVEVTEGDRSIRLEPADDLELDVRIDFASDVIGEQRTEIRVDAAAFVDLIAPARTFAFMDEVEALRASGLALGGGLHNCVVLDAGAVANPGGLRFPDEFVRHKTLDLIGDLLLAGAPLRGRVIADRPGHRMNNAILRRAMDEGALTRTRAARPSWLARRRRLGRNAMPSAA